MKDWEGRRIVFGDFVDRLFWLLLIGVSGYGVRQIQNLNNSVAMLNQNMAIVMYQIPDQSKRIERIENRQDQFSDDLRFLKLRK